MTSFCLQTVSRLEWLLTLYYRRTRNSSRARESSFTAQLPLSAPQPTSFPTPTFSLLAGRWSRTVIPLTFVVLWCESGISAFPMIHLKFSCFGSYGMVIMIHRFSELCCPHFLSCFLWQLFQIQASSNTLIPVWITMIHTQQKVSLLRKFCFV